MQFVDTNIFIRYFTGDEPEKAQACLRLFEQVQRSEVILTTSESVIAEIVFILSSRRLYNLSWQDVRIRLYPILSLQGLRLAHKQQYLVRPRSLQQ